MKIKYNIEINDFAIDSNLKRLLNQIYKLLPNREEGIEWRQPLKNIIEEFVGMNSLLLKEHEKFFSLLCKLEGLLALTKEEDFPLFRSTIFECLNIISCIRKNMGFN